MEHLSVKVAWLLLLATGNVGSGKRRLTAVLGSMCLGPLLVPCRCAPFFPTRIWSVWGETVAYSSFSLGREGKGSDLTLERTHGDRAVPKYQS